MILVRDLNSRIIFRVSVSDRSNALITSDTITNNQITLLHHCFIDTYSTQLYSGFYIRLVCEEHFTFTLPVSFHGLYSSFDLLNDRLRWKQTFLRLCCNGNGKTDERANNNGAENTVFFDTYRYDWSSPTKFFLISSFCRFSRPLEPLALNHTCPIWSWGTGSLRVNNGCEENQLSFCIKYTFPKSNDYISEECAVVRDNVRRETSGERL